MSQCTALSSGASSTTSKPIIFLPLFTSSLNTSRVSLYKKPSGSGVPVAGIIDGSKKSISKVIYTVSERVSTAFFCQFSP